MGTGEEGKSLSIINCRFFNLFSGFTLNLQTFTRACDENREKGLEIEIPRERRIGVGAQVEIEAHSVVGVSGCNKSTVKEIHLCPLSLGREVTGAYSVSPRIRGILLVADGITQVL